MNRVSRFVLILTIAASGLLVSQRGQSQDPGVRAPDGVRASEDGKGKSGDQGVRAPGESSEKGNDASTRKPASGAGEGKSKTPHLDEIVVTATRTDERLRNVPVNVEVIKARDIEETGDVSLADVLGKRVTGNYMKYQGGLSVNGMRGFNNDVFGDELKGHVLVLIDGHRLGSANLAKIPPEMIERIEVIKGPASSLYGALAMGGVINIITKKGKGPLYAGVKGEAGSFNYLKGAGWAGGMISDWASFHVFGSRMAMGDYRTDDYGTVHNSWQRDWHTGGNLTFYIGQKQTLRFGFSYSDMTSGFPEWRYTRGVYDKEKYDHYVQDETFVYLEYDQNNRQYNHRERAHADAEYNLKALNDKIQWRSMVYYLRDFNKTNYGDIYLNQKPEDYAYSSDDQTWGTDQQFTFVVPYNKIVVGYTGEHLKRITRNKEAGKSATPFVPSMESRTNSGYAEDMVSLFDERLIFVIGGRYDSYEVNLLKPATGSYASFSRTKRTFQNFSPRGGVVVRPLEWFRLRGNIGASFRPPTPEELAAEYELAWDRWLGNKDLKPESGYTRETGFDISLRSFTFGATYFFTYAKNMIQKSGDKTEYQGKQWTTWENVGAVEIEGYDVFASIAAGKLLELPVDLDLSSSATFNRRYRNMITNADLMFVADQEVKSSLRVGYKQASVTLFHVYVGTQNVYNWDDPYNSCVEIKDPFYYFDLTFQWHISKHVKIDGGIFNLTNRDYEWVRTYPMPERNYKLGVTGTL